MKKIYLISIIFLLSVKVNSQNLYNLNVNTNFDSTILYYESGVIKEIYYFKPYKVRSLCFYENGNRKSETQFDSPLLDSTFMSWFYINNKKEFLYKLNLGEKDSTEVEWYENGQMKSKVQWKKGALDGYLISWYTNGLINNISNFENGKENGKEYNFYKNGNLSSVREWKNRKYIGEHINYFESGKLYCYGNLGEDGNGIIKYYTEEGELYREDIYENGEIIKSIDYSYPESIYNPKN